MYAILSIIWAASLLAAYRFGHIQGWSDGYREGAKDGWKQA